MMWRVFRAIVLVLCVYLCVGGDVCLGDTGASDKMNSRVVDENPPPLSDSPPKMSRLNPILSTRDSALLGSGCSYHTEMMAQRVLARGIFSHWVGVLKPADRSLDSRVAVPFSLDSRPSVFVVANQVLDWVVRVNAHHDALTLWGKELEVDGILYFVPTAYL